MKNNIFDNKKYLNVNLNNLKIDTKYTSNGKLLSIENHINISYIWYLFVIK